MSGEELNETTCPRCKYDAADPRSWAYRLGKGPYCGTSDDTQPMYACRFGKAAYDEASKDWEPMPLLDLKTGRIVAAPPSVTAGED